MEQEQKGAKIVELNPVFKRTTLMMREDFVASKFKTITEGAKKVIESAKPDQLLAITITMNSPFSVIDAKLYNFGVFEEILRR